MTDENINKAAEAYWQNDLAKFTPTLKNCPNEYTAMFKAGAAWAEQQKYPQVTTKTEHDLSVTNDMLRAADEYILGQNDRIFQLEQSLEEVVWYAKQLEVLVYAEEEQNTEHPYVQRALNLLEEGYELYESVLSDLSADKNKNISKVVNVKTAKPNMP